MKKPLLYLVLLLLAGLASWCFGYFHKDLPARSLLKSESPGLEWLRRELALTPPQYEKILKLHKDYQPACDEMCDRVRESNKKLATLITSNHQSTPELKTAIRENSILRELCQSAMMDHVYLVNRELTPEQSKRYLDLMQAHILNPNYAAPKAR